MNEEKFCEKVWKTYNKKIFFKKLFKLKNIININNTEEQFKQVGMRLNIKNNLFNENTAEDIGNGLANGELNYLISLLKSKKKNSKLLNQNDLTELLDLLSESSLIVAILIPINSKYFHNMSELISSNQVIVKNGDYYLYFNDEKKILIKWSTRYTPFDEIFIIKNNAIDLKYKSPENIYEWEEIKTHKKIIKNNIEIRILKNISYYDVLVRNVPIIKIDYSKIERYSYE